MITLNGEKNGFVHHVFRGQRPMSSLFSFQTIRDHIWMSMNFNSDVYPTHDGGHCYRPMLGTELIDGPIF